MERLIVLGTGNATVTRSRKEPHTAEGREYHSGNLFVPDDLGVIPLCP